MNPVFIKYKKVFFIKVHIFVISQPVFYGSLSSDGKISGILKDGRETMLTVTVIDTEGTWYEYRYPQPESSLSIGRSEENRIVLRDDVVSSKHGELIFQNGRMYYRDFSSSNGTQISAGGMTRKLYRNSMVVELPWLSVLKIGSAANVSRQVMILIQQVQENASWSLYPVSDQPVKIGSSPECAIMLSKIGGCATEIIQSGPECLIVKRSAEPLLVNGLPVSSEKILQDNDLIQTGEEVLVFTRSRILFRQKSEGLSLRGFHITKMVPGKHGRPKKILDDVNISIEPNQFTAIIGGSGAGKTTLMNALSGFEPEFQGDSQAGGSSLRNSFNSMKHLIGFVPQQDILYENLTLSKMLDNAARLRMDPKTSRKQRRERVKAVLKMVDLEDHSSTVISKLSGGQKKRASIAVELLADPKVFFLDEPSSGLDPGTEKSLMVMLNHLAREQKKTIVMVTHNITNLDLCDQVIFMERGGRLAFAGSSGMAREYFHKQDLTDVYTLLNEDKDGQWASRFRSVQPEVRQDRPDPSLLKAPKKDHFFRQFRIFTDRYLTLLLRDPKRMLLLLGQPVFMALVLWMVSSEDTFVNFNATQSILFSMSCAAIWLGLFDTIQEICKERVIVKREYMSRLKLLPYLCAKFLISASLGLIQALLLGGVFLMLLEHRPEGIWIENPYPEIIFTLWLTVLAAQALGFIVSALAKSGEKAMTYAPMLLIVQLLFSGILFKLKGLGEIIADFTISKWSVQALGVIADLNSLPTQFEQDYPNLEIEREIQEVFDHTAANLEQDWLVLLAMIVVCLGITLLLLKRIKKDRR